MDASVNPAVPDSGTCAMSLHETLRARRSVYSYLDSPVPRAALEHALADAVLAPNHHRTAPWRFFVITREGRGKLVQAYERAAQRLGRDVARAATRAKDAPLNIVVACVPALENPRVTLREEEFATACAVENLLLSLASRGIATLLTTGDLAESAEVAQLVGLPPDAGRIVGVVNVGYRNTERPVAPRPEPDLARVVTWIGEE